jgi:hypothetical protein
LQWTAGAGEPEPADLDGDDRAEILVGTEARRLYRSREGRATDE